MTKDVVGVAQLVVAGALVMCPMGKIPASLVVTPEGSMVTAGAPVATIMDFTPLNMATFGVCNSPANPATLNPSGSAPCVPAVVAPWTPGSLSVLVNGIPALTSDSMCICMLSGGIPISVIEPGQVNVIVAG